MEVAGLQVHPGPGEDLGHVDQEGGEGDRQTKLPGASSSGGCRGHPHPSSSSDEATSNVSPSRDGDWEAGISLQHYVMFKHLKHVLVLLLETKIQSR